MPLYNAAMNLHEAGLNLVPLAGLKPTIKWSEYQTRKQTKEEIKKLFFKDSVNGIAVICGKVSGNLEMIDVDSKNSLVDDFNDRLMSAINDHAHQIISRCVIERTKSGGLHIYYRCAEITGNKKLAERYTTAEEKDKNGKPKTKTLVETRGEGGFSYCEPTTGYEVIQGDLAEIQTIEPFERDILFEIIRYADEVNKPTEKIDNKTYSYGKNNFKITPWDDYNENGDILSELQNHGWEITDEKGERIYIKRPGTDNDQSGNYHCGLKLLYIFSTNTEFPSEKGIPPFQAYAYLNHGGDTSKATHELEEIGYGKRFSSIEENAIHHIQELKGKNKSKEEIVKTINKKFNSDVPGTIDVKELYEKGLDAFEANKNVSKGPFWTRNKQGNISIDKDRLMSFGVREMNLYRYHPDGYDKEFKMVQIDEDLRTIGIRETAQLKEIFMKWASDPSNYKDTDAKTNEIRNALINQHSNCFKESVLEYWPEIKEVDQKENIKENTFRFIRDTKDASFHFFNNGYVEITDKGYSFKSYSSLPDNHFVWEDQVIDFEFQMMKMTPTKVASSKWFQFLRRISGLGKEYDKYGLNFNIKELTDTQKTRWLSTVTNTGFLCHNFKDEKLPFAIVAQEDTDDQEHGGGTGKGLYSKGIAHLRNLVNIDGKTFDPQNQFCYQRVKLDTQVLVLQDVTKNLPVEKLYNPITDGITIRRLYSAEIFIPFQDSPKLFITTNYTLKGAGDHYDRRFRFQLFSRHFNKDHTPFDELGQLFNEWPNEQWQLYYNVMFEIISTYLDMGLVQVKDTANVKVKSIKTNYSSLFYDWIRYWAEECPKNEPHIVKDLYDEFVNEYSSKLGYFSFNAGMEDYFKMFGIEFQWSRWTSGTKKGQKAIIIKSDDPQDVEEEELPF